MSPAQASGHSEIDGRSDQFSLGLIVYEMLTGKKACFCRQDPTPHRISLSHRREHSGTTW
jgi:hypothetical protein